MFSTREGAHVNFLLYDHNSILIAGVLFLVLLAANEAGYRSGLRRSRRHDEGAKTQTTAIQAGMVGLLALLLGFTFSMALQRFDNRSAAVIDEANAIGTASLRTLLLPEPAQAEARKAMREYIDLRIDSADVDLTQTDLRRRARAATDRLHERLWALALEASELDPRPVTTGLFIQSLNELIDSYGRRIAALKKQVPEVVLLLLFAVFIVNGAVLGYAGGLGAARAGVATVAMSLLIVLVIFLIVDLDRPRRGIIQVKQDALIDLSSEVTDARRAVEESAAPLE